MTYPDPQSPYPQTERGWSSAHLAAKMPMVLMPTRVVSMFGSTTPPNGCWSARRSTAMLQVTKLVYPSQFRMTENGWPLDRARMKTAQAAFGHTPLWRIRHRRHRQAHRQAHRHLHHRVLRRRVHLHQAHRRQVRHHQVHRRRVHLHQAHRRQVHRHQVRHHQVYRRRPVRHRQQIQRHRRHHRRTHLAMRISMR